MIGTKWTWKNYHGFTEPVSLCIGQQIRNDIKKKKKSYYHGVLWTSLSVYALDNGLGMEMGGGGEERRMEGTLGFYALNKLVTYTATAVDSKGVCVGKTTAALTTERRGLG